MAIPPLINLDFKIVKGDSLVSKICGFVFDLETQLSGKVKITEAQYLISVPMRTFKATLNTGIYLFKKSAVDTEKDNWGCRDKCIISSW